MNINLEKFQQFLTKKDKKHPIARPMTCVPQGHSRHYSNLEPSNQQSLFKRPDNIGCTIRVSTYQKKSHRKIKSNSLYDPLTLQEKLVKMKLRNTVGTKQLVLRSKVQNIEKGYFKDKLNQKLKDWGKNQTENVKRIYQKKKLRVVKGKTNVYRQKLRGIEVPQQSETLNMYSNTKDVSIVGTKIL